MAGRKGGLSFYKKQSKVNKNVLGQVLKFVFWGLAMILLAFVIVFCFGIRTSIIGKSMEPTVYEGQEILVNRFAYFIGSPKRGDIIVFRPNGNENAHMHVKRVIGKPGDTILISNGLIYINGKAYDDGKKYGKIIDPGIASTGITLGEDEYFVLGDNRNNSEDSRSSDIGLVKSDYIIGKAWYRIKGKGHRAGFIK